MTLRVDLSSINGLDSFQVDSNGGKQVKSRQIIGIGNSDTSERWRVDKDGSPVKVIRDKNGAKIQETKYHVDEKTGKETIYSVTRFSFEPDEGYGLYTVKTSFVDEDGDGFSDKKVIQKYSNGKLVNTETLIQENINSIKNRDHMPYELENRKMATHDSGYYMM